MTPEGRLLRSLLTALGGRLPRPALLPPEEINWENFRNRVKQHRIGPLFHRELTGTIPFPDSVWKGWAEEFQLQLARTVLHGDCLRSILDAFSRRSIDSLVLKGSHLGEMYYAHPALRPADDLDLLIRPRDAKPAGEILEQAGGVVQEKTATAGKYLLPETGVFLELHTNLQAPERRNPAFAIRIEDFWRESAPARIAGGETRVLSPTLNLLYLSAHLSHHAFSRLIWFYDLFLVIEKSGGEIEWESFTDRAGEFRCAGQVYYPLLLTGIFFGKTAPESVLARLAPRPVKRLVTRRFISSAAVLEDRTPASGLKARLNRLLLNDSWPLALGNFCKSSLGSSNSGQAAHPADEKIST